MKKILASISIITLLLAGISFSYSDSANAAPKKGSVVTIKGKKYTYVGKYDHYFTKAHCKKIAKYAKNYGKLSNFVGGSSGVAAAFKKGGYASVASSLVFLSNYGVQNSATAFKKAAKKGTGVRITYEMYVPQGTTTDLGIPKNIKYQYK